jgi:Flp pilus assembly protein TadD
MSGPRTKRWIAVFCACAAAVAVLVAVRRSNAPRLPPEAHYANLPAAFERALTSRREKVLDGDFNADDVSQLAHLYQANTLYDEASACYAINAKRGVLSAKDHYYRATIAQNRGDLEGAEAELRAVTAMEPHYLAARLQLADILFKAGRPEDASKEYAAVLGLEANQPQAMFALARIDLMNGDDGAAVARLSTLMTSHPEMTSGAALLAQVFDRLGEDKRAKVMRQWSRQPPEPQPKDPWTDDLFADCYDIVRLGLKFEDYFSSGQVSLAVPLLSRIEELDPASPIPPLLRGWEFSRAHDDLDAVQEFQKALDKGGDPDKLCPYMAQSLIALGRPKDALKLLADYNGRKPDSIPILTAYADLSASLGDTANAKVLLTRLVEKQPYLKSANLNLARILWASGDRDGAAACLKRVAEVNAGDVASRALLGEYHLGKSDPAAAIAPLEEAVALEGPQGARRANLVGMLYTAYVRAGNNQIEAGRLQAALAEDFDKAIVLMPEGSAAYFGKALASARLKDFAKAAAALGKLSLLEPANPTVFLGLGDVQFLGGDKEGARASWTKALSLAGDRDDKLRADAELRLNAPDSGTAQ